MIMIMVVSLFHSWLDLGLCWQAIEVAAVKPLAVLLSPKC